MNYGFYAYLNFPGFRGKLLILFEYFYNVLQKVINRPFFTMEISLKIHVICENNGLIQDLLLTYSKTPFSHFPTKKTLLEGKRRL